MVCFTEKAIKLMNLIPSDVGLPLGDIVTKLKYDKMIEDARNVLHTLQYKEVPMEVENGDWYQMRIMPYKNQEQMIQGVVITFASAKEYRSIKKLSKGMKQFAEGIVEASTDPLVALDQELKIIAANNAFCRLFAVSNDGCQGRGIYDVVDQHVDELQLKQLLEKDLLQKSRVTDGVIRHRSDEGVRNYVVDCWRIEACGEGFPCMPQKMRPA